MGFSPFKKTVKAAEWQHRLRDAFIWIDFQKPVEFYGRNDGKLYANGRVFFIKGVNWYGTEEKSMMLEGLDKRSMADIFDEIVRHAARTARSTTPVRSRDQGSEGSSRLGPGGTQVCGELSADAWLAVSM